MLISKLISKLIPSLVSTHQYLAAPHTNPQIPDLPALIMSEDAQFLRAGNDLVITLPTDSWVIRDYFNHPTALTTQTGETLSVAQVYTLLSEQPIMVAANEGVTGLTATGKAIGTVTDVVEGPVTAQDTSGNTRTLNKTDQVYEHDIIVTVARSYVKLTLNDGTVLQLGPFSRASLDKYSFDANKVGGEFEANIFTGFFRYISGKISGDHHGQHTVINTPSANIGIRGSEIDAQIDQEGSTTILHLEGLVTAKSRHYASEEIVVYERGVTIFIPNDNASPVLSRATDPQISHDYDKKWEVFSHDAPVDLPTEEPSAAPESSLGPVDTVGGRSPFSPLDETPTNDVPSKVDEVELNKGTPPMSPHHPSFITPIEVDTKPEGRHDDRPVVHLVSREETSHPEESPLPNTPVDQEDGQPTELPPMIPSTDTSVPKPPDRTNITTTTAATLNEDETLPLPVNGNFSAITATPLHGKVETDENQTTLIYKPDPNFNGNDSFTYTVPNGDSVRVDLTVRGVNDIPEVKSDNFTLAEDHTLVLSPQDLLGNDIDVDAGDQLTIVSVSAILREESNNRSTDNRALVNLTHGEVRLTPTGEIIYTPEPNFNGQAQFNYTVQDSQGGRQTNTVSVEVTAVNDAPTVVSDLISVSDFHLTAGVTSFSWSTAELLANDSDIDGDPLTIVAVLNANHGEVQLVGNNIIFTPDADIGATGGFDYVVSDGNLTSTGQALLTSSAPLNTPPLAQDDLITTTSGRSNTFISSAALLENDLDSQGHPLTIIAVTKGDNGEVRLDNNGNVIFTPTDEFISQGGGNFTYQISDGQGGVDTAAVRVNLVNQPPIANDDTLTTNTLDGLLITPNQLLGNDYDPEGGPLTLQMLGSAVNGDLSMTSHGNFIFIPTLDLVTQTTGSFSYQITDSNGQVNTATVTIYFDNSPPTAKNLTQTVTELPTVGGIIIKTTDLLSNYTRDPDNDTITVTQVTNPENGTVRIDKDGNLVFMPTETFLNTKTGSFTYEITDGQGHTAQAQINIVLNPLPNELPPNEPPVANDDVIDRPQFTSPISITASELLVNDQEPEQEPLTIVNVHNGQNGSVTLDPQGNILFVPTPAFSEPGQGTFTYDLSDGQGHIVTATVTVTAPPVTTNQPPIATPDQFDLGRADTITLSSAQLLQNDSDPDNDPLTLTVSAGTAQNGNVTRDAQGNILFERGPEFAGEGRFTYEVSDGKGGVAQAQVTLTGQLNRPPEANDITLATTKNQPMAILLATPQNFVDPDGDPVTLSSVTSPANGSVTLDATNSNVSTQPGEIPNSWVFTPADNFTGETSFTYTITDAYGATDTATVTVTVTNTPPVAVVEPQPFYTAINQTLTLATSDLLANDTDSDPGDQATLQIVNVNQAINGNVTLVDGQIEFTPTPAFKGDANFLYTIADRSGAQSSNIVTVIVTNEFKLNTDNFTIPQETTLSLTANDLLSNDVKVNDSDVLTLTAVENGTHGTVVQDPILGTIHFTPEANFVGTADFTYTASDSRGNTGQATVTVQVKALDAVADEATTPANIPLTLAVEDLLKNDIGEQLNLTAVNNPTHGEVSFTGNQIDFTPAKDYEGAASFDYTITDSEGDPASTTVTITVTPPNESPVINLPSGDMPLIYQVGDEPQSIDAQAVVTDPDSTNFDTGQLQVNLVNRQPGDLLEIQNRGLITVSNPTGGTISFNGIAIGSFFTLLATGVLAINLTDQATPENTSALVEAITYRNPSSNLTADVTRTVTFTLTDGDGGTSALVSREIQVQGDAHLIAQDDSLSIPFNTPLTISVNELLSNDSGPNPTEVLAITSVTADSPGVEINLVNHEVQLFIDALVSNQFDSATFDYTVSDGNGGTDTATVTMMPTNVIMGTMGNDSLSGTPNIDIMVGQEGNDTFAPPQGADYLLGGGGDDLFLFDPTTAAGAVLRGDTGIDTLSLSSQGNRVLDLTKNDELPAFQKFDLQGIEVIDLTSPSDQGNQLRLSVQDVLNLSDNGQLTIKGDTTSFVTSRGQGWIDQGLDSTGLYHHYAAGGAELLVSSEIAFQLIS